MQLIKPQIIKVTSLSTFIITSIPLLQLFHEIPQLAANGFDVLPLASQLPLLLRFGEDSTLSESYVSTDPSNLCVDLNFLSGLYWAQKLRIEGNRYSFVGRHSQDGDSGNEIDKCC